MKRNETILVPWFCNAVRGLSRGVSHEFESLTVKKLLPYMYFGGKCTELPGGTVYIYIYIYSCIAASLICVKVLNVTVHDISMIARSCNVKIESIAYIGHAKFMLKFKSFIFK